MIILTMFALLVKLPMFLNPYIPVVHPKDGILFHIILRWLQPVGENLPAIYPILAFLFIMIQAFWLNGMMNTQRMMTRSTFLPAMSFILVTSLFPEWNYFSAPLLVNFALLFMLNLSFKIYHQTAGKSAIFNMGLAIGIASFLFFPSVAFFLLAFFALMIMRPFRFNEWLICLLGITAPFYFYIIYLVVAGNWDPQRLLPYVNIKLPSLIQSIWIAGSTLLLVIPFLVGGYFVQDNLRRMLIQVRKGWSVILIYLLVALLIPFVNNANTFENWVIATLPIAAFHSCTYFYPLDKLFPLVLFWITTAFIISFQYLGPGW
ncbi:MAG: hypothetical protein H0V30_14915 [Chitinophagaceae bacterium]|nr:hypothetical protein [Chitinophagaceae bacterium]